MDEATTTGLTAAQSVERLKRIHWSLKLLSSLLIARIPSMPIYELKRAFSLHAHFCAEHVGEFASRVREMRQPSHGLEISPDPMLDMFPDEVLAAPAIEPLLLGLYEHVMPAMVRALEHLIADTNELFDYPTFESAVLLFSKWRTRCATGKRLLRA